MAIICSDGYMHFYNALQADTVSMDDILNLIPGALLHVVDELNIGKFEIRIDPASTVSNAAPAGMNRVFYESPDGFEHLAHTRTIKTPDKERFSVAAFPRKGYSWNPEEKDSIDFIIRNLYLIMQKARISEQLNKRQLTDHLTLLPNTTSFNRFCGDLGIKGILDQYTIIFSNLRSFNYINQTMGSQAGDAVLKEYSRKLADFYAPDEMIARFGGDNFVAILKNENVDRYLKYISNVNITVATGNQTRTMTLGSRSGIYPIPEAVTNVGEAISRANASLAYAREHGNSDTVWFREEILEQSNREREVISYFPKALAHKEFLVYYQPKVNVLTNRISGCEALVRWKRDDRIISPGGFVPVLEDEGLICDLDFYMLERVCEHIGQWLEDGITPARVSVNFSKLHLKNPHLVDDIMTVISRHRVNTEYLEIELTESASSEDFRALETFVDRLSERGIHTSIDDFGTGYSSLSLLKDLNVNMIKIDKSFVDNIADEDNRDRIILKSILTMITELGMDVIAEGCETVEQARILRDLDCILIQGYLFDKPMPFDEYTDNLRSGYVYPITL